MRSFAGLLAAGWAIAGWLVFYGGAAALAETPQMLKDLQGVITIKGLSCDGVKAYTERGPKDYMVFCKNGKTYRVVVGANNTVSVTAVNN